MEDAVKLGFLSKLDFSPKENVVTDPSSWSSSKKFAHFLKMNDYILESGNANILLEEFLDSNTLYHYGRKGISCVLKKCKKEIKKYINKCLRPTTNGKLDNSDICDVFLLTAKGRKGRKYIKNCPCGEPSRPIDQTNKKKPKKVFLRSYKWVLRHDKSVNEDNIKMKTPVVGDLPATTESSGTEAALPSTFSKMKKAKPKSKSLFLRSIKFTKRRRKKAKTRYKLKLAQKQAKVSGTKTVTPKKQKVMSPPNPEAKTSPKKSLLDSICFTWSEKCGAYAKVKGQNEKGQKFCLSKMSNKWEKKILDIIKSQKAAKLSSEPANQSSLTKEKIIFVQIGHKTISVNFDINESVDKLMKTIEQKEGFRPEHQRLQFAGKQLQPGRLLSDYGLQRECTLHLLLDIKGGADSSNKVSSYYIILILESINIPFFFEKILICFSQFQCNFGQMTEKTRIERPCNGELVVFSSLFESTQKMIMNRIGVFDHELDAGLGQMICTGHLDYLGAGWDNYMSKSRKCVCPYHPDKKKSVFIGDRHFSFDLEKSKAMFEKYDSLLPFNGKICDYCRIHILPKYPVDSSKQAPAVTSDSDSAMDTDSVIPSAPLYPDIPAVPGPSGLPNIPVPGPSGEDRPPPYSEIENKNDQSYYSDKDTSDEDCEDEESGDEEFDEEEESDKNTFQHSSNELWKPDSQEVKKMGEDNKKCPRRKALNELLELCQFKKQCEYTLDKKTTFENITSRSQRDVMKSMTLGTKAILKTISKNEDDHALIFQKFIESGKINKHFKQIVQPQVVKDIINHYNNCIKTQERKVALSGLVKHYSYGFLRKFNSKNPKKPIKKRRRLTLVEEEAVVSDNETDYSEDSEWEDMDPEPAQDYDVLWSPPITRKKFRDAREWYIKHGYPYARDDSSKHRKWKWSAEEVDLMFDFISSSEFYQDVAFKG